MMPSYHPSERLGCGALLLVIFCGLLYLPGISKRDLWRPDEVRYTEVAREMDVTGSLILPKLNGKPYPDKPPLFFWLSILVSRITGGWSPVPARVVSAAGAMGTVLLTFLMARRLGIPRAGIASGIVLASAVQFVWISRWGVMDSTFSFFITLTLYAFLESRLGRKTPWLFVAYFFTGMAVLTKGPLAIVISGVVAGITIARLDGPRHLLARSLVWGVPVMIIPVAVWLVPDIILAGGWGHGREVIFAQNIGRLKPSAGAHTQSIFYYLANFPADFLPWTLFLPGALFLLARDTSMPRETRVFLAAYFLGSFLFLSLLPPKRQKYLLPIYPAAAILVGHLLTCRETIPIWAKLERTIRIPGQILTGLFFCIGLIILAATFCGVSVASAFVPHFALEIESLIGSTPSRLCFLLTGLLVVAGVLLSLKPMRKNPAKGSLFLISFVFLVVFTGMGMEILPRANSFKSVKEFCLVLDEQIEETVPIGVYKNIYQGAYNFYLDRNHLALLHTPKEVNRFMSEPGFPVLILRESELSQIQEEAGTSFQVLAKGRFEHYMMVAITRKQAAEKRSRHF